MMKKLLSNAILLVVFTSLSLAASDKKRVAILDFEFGTVQKWWKGNWDIGKGISDLLVDKLVNDGTYSIIERKKLDTVMTEQNFSNSNRADSSSAAKVGKVLGVNGMVVGSITQFGIEKKNMSIGGIAGRFGKFGGGKFGKNKGKATVAVTARIIDTNTGEILASKTGKGESQRSGIMLGGMGAGGGGFGAGGISMGSSDFRETILGEAVHAAVDDLAKQLIEENGRLPNVEYVIRGMIADVDGSSLILNVGSGAGLKAGDTLKILRVKRTVKDPATGKVLREITTSVGEARIDEADEGSSMATVVSGSDVQVGDLVRN